VHVWDTRLLRYPWLEQHTELARLVHPIDADPGVLAVFVQADCIARQALAEVRYVEGLDWPRLAGIVAFAPLESGSAAEPALAELASHPRVVGVRRLLQGEPAGFVSDPRFAAGLAAAARHGFVFDATIRADQLEELAAAHRAVPEAVLVLDHLGNPPLAEGLDSAAGRAWREGLAAVAANPAAVAKLSGRVAGDTRHGPGFARAALEAFGPDRMMLGSDHPLTVPADPEAYRRWTDTADARLGLNGAERAAVRRDTALRTYRLKESPR
jgi:L-fuconolactonase